MNYTQNTLRNGGSAHVVASRPASAWGREAAKVAANTTKAQQAIEVSDSDWAQMLARAAQAIS